MNNQVAIVPETRPAPTKADKSRVVAFLNSNFLPDDEIAFRCMGVNEMQIWHMRDGQPLKDLTEGFSWLLQLKKGEQGIVNLNVIKTVYILSEMIDCLTTFEIADYRKGPQNAHGGSRLAKVSF